MTNVTYASEYESKPYHSREQIKFSEYSYKYFNDSELQIHINFSHLIDFISKEAHTLSCVLFLTQDKFSEQRLLAVLRHSQGTSMSSFKCQSVETTFQGIITAISQVASGHLNDNIKQDRILDSKVVFFLIFPLAPLNDYILYRLLWSPSPTI